MLTFHVFDWINVLSPGIRPVSFYLLCMLENDVLSIINNILAGIKHLKYITIKNTFYQLIRYIAFIAYCVSKANLEKYVLIL